MIRQFGKSHCMLYPILIPSTIINSMDIFYGNDARWRKKHFASHIMRSKTLQYFQNNCITAYTYHSRRHCFFVFEQLECHDNLHFQQMPWPLAPMGGFLRHLNSWPLCSAALFGYLKTFNV